jgi:hypothetical protein
MNTTGRKTTKSTKTSAPMVKTSKASSASTKAAPTHDEIAKRSYELYLARGGEAGHVVEDWLRAETELKGI